MVYTFMGILCPYSSIHVQGGYEEAQRHTCTKFMPEIPPRPLPPPHPLPSGSGHWFTPHVLCFVVGIRASFNTHLFYIETFLVDRKWQTILSLVAVETLEQTVNWLNMNFMSWSVLSLYLLIILAFQSSILTLILNSVNILLYIWFLWCYPGSRCPRWKGVYHNKLLLLLLLAQKWEIPKPTPQNHDLILNCENFKGVGLVFPLLVKNIGWYSKQYFAYYICRFNSSSVN